MRKRTSQKSDSRATHSKNVARSASRVGNSSSVQHHYAAHENSNAAAGSHGGGSDTNNSKALVPVKHKNSSFGGPESMLVAALIEHYVDTHPSTVHLSAKQKKQCHTLLVHQLARASPGLQGVANALSMKEMSGVRSNYLGGLENLLWMNVEAVQNVRTNAVINVNPEVNLSGNPSTLLSSENASQPLLMFNTEGRHKPIFTSSRYRSEFEPLGFLGKGGFGSVYRVQQKIDNQIYAIKIVPITSSMLMKFVQSSSSKDASEITEKVFREIRTLAKFEHENIVRYYSGWIEDYDRDYLASGSSDDDSLEDFQTEESLAAGREQHSFGGLRNHRGMDSTKSSNDFLVAQGFNRFETLSEEKSQEPDKKDYEEQERQQQEEDSWEDDDSSSDADDPTDSYESENSGPPQKKDRPPPRYDEIAEQFNDESDIFDRNASGVSVDISSNQRRTLVSRNPQPLYSLFMQMSFHPISLAEFILPAMSNRPLPDMYPTHKHHPIPSMKLLLKILKGVQHMHELGMVHRDIKPANVFLTIETSLKGARGGVQMGGCFCGLDETADSDSTIYKCHNPHCQPEVHCWVVPKIGDFGLVADLKQHLEDSAGPLSPGGKGVISQNAGTTFYKPPRLQDILPKAELKLRPLSINPCPKTDVYALGIIMFEMLYAMKTCTERVHILSDIVDSNVLVERLHDTTGDELDLPAAFPTCEVPDWYAEELRRCLGFILHPDKDKRWSLQEMKDNLVQLVP